MQEQNTETSIPLQIQTVKIMMREVKKIVEIGFDLYVVLNSSQVILQQHTQKIEITVLWNDTNNSLYLQNTVKANRQNPMNMGPKDTKSRPTNTYDFLIKKEIWQSSFQVLSFRMYNQEIKQVTPSKIKIYLTVNMSTILIKLEYTKKKATSKSGRSDGCIWLSLLFIFSFISCQFLILNFLLLDLC